MKQNISFFKKIKVFFYYKKTLKKLETELNTQFNIRIDDAYRMYTVINLPSDIAPYVTKTSDREKIADKYIIDTSNKLSNYLNSNGLAELYKRYSISKVGETNYLIVYGYSLLQTDKIISGFYVSLIYLIACSTIVGMVMYVIQSLNS